MKSNLVIGCGLIGLTTALELLRRGERVTLVDAADHEGLGTSFANGGLLTPSMPDPWNSPGIHRHLWEYVTSSSSALKLRLAALPSLWTWGPRFLLNSRRIPYETATKANFELASYSLAVLRDMKRDYSLAFDALDNGTLKIFRSELALDQALAISRKLEPQGLVARRVDASSLSGIEPCLVPIQDQLVGGIFYPGDGSGDAYQFCQAVAAAIRELGGRFRYNTPVHAIEVRKGRVRGVRVSDGVIDADVVIVASGVASPALAARLGAKLAVKPVKGYSMTFAPKGARPMPRIPVVDDANHAAVTPMGDRLRVAGTAEFAGLNLRLDPARLDNLSQLFRRIFPQLADEETIAEGRPWAGLRPVAADGRPYIGPAAVEGLWINSGHGHLGWTQAAGSARLLVDLMHGAKPGVNPAQFAVNR